MKKLSIVLPCYNAEKYIRETLESIISQTFPMADLEVIAVDNGSEDGTLSILQEYEEAYPESFLLVVIPQNRMAGYARNTGLSYVTAPFVLFVDSDDWLLENALEEIYQKMVELDVDVLEFDCMTGVSKETLKPRGAENTEAVQIFRLEDDTQRRIFYAAGMKSGFPFTKLFKTEFLRSNQIYFAEGLRYEDTIFIMMVTLLARTYAIYDKSLYGYRINDSGISFGCRKNDYGQFDRMKVQQLMIRECDRRGLLERFYDMIEANFMRVGYAETFQPVVRRFDHLPKELVEMGALAKSYFPNYKQNYFLNLPQNKWVLKILESLDQELTEEEFKRWKAVE